MNQFLDNFAMDQIGFHAHRLATTLHLSPEDQEDLKQEMALELIQASQRFDPEKASKETFVVRVLARFSKYATRKHFSQQGNPVGSAESLDPNYDLHKMARPGGQADVERRLDVEEVISQLPEQLQEICRALMTNSVSEAAAILGVDKSTIYRKIPKIREYFISFGLGELCDTFATSADITNEE